jgi:O-antigen/teichoic acid export membrane protein
MDKDRGTVIRLVISRIREILIARDQVSADHRERGAERNRRAMLTGSAAAMARLAQISTSLITVPLTLRYLGNERFGLWMAISSVLAMAAFADFGIGNGVLNTVADAFGKGDVEEIRRAISSGFAILTLIAVMLLVLFFAIYPFVHWADFFRVVTPLARVEAGPALSVFAVCFALNISMDVVQRVQMGLQQGYRFSLWQLAGSLGGFTGVMAGIWFQVSLPLLVTAVAGAPVLATALNTLHFFGFVRPDLRPSQDRVSKTVLRNIARLGGLFFVLQLVVAIAYSADNIIIARNLGAAAVPEYSVPQRMFALITMMTSMLVAPLWPAYSEAISRGDLFWVRQTLKRSMLVVLALGLTGSCLLWLFAPVLLNWWVGMRVHPSLLLLTGLAVWTVLASSGDALSSFLNGAAVIKTQVIVAALFGVVCLAAKIALIRRIGVAGVPWATIGSYVIMVVIPYSIFVPRIVRGLAAKGTGIPKEC